MYRLKRPAKALMMAAQIEASHNPGARSSAKRDFSLAARVAKMLGLVPTWPNLQTIRLAIESEALLSAVSMAEAAEVLIRDAKEPSICGVLHCPSEWEKREIARINTVDRFWFEDARWRSKFAYQDFVAERRRDGVAC